MRKLLIRRSGEAEVEWKRNLSECARLENACTVKPITTQL